MNYPSTQTLADPQLHSTLDNSVTKCVASNFGDGMVCVTELSVMGFTVMTYWSFKKQTTHIYLESVIALYHKHIMFV